MRNLINVVLFVLVLCGSVVPVSAQSEGGGMTAEAWTIIAVGAVLLGVILTTWMASRADNRAAHREIGENITGVKKDLREDVRESEKRVNDNINKVHGDVRLLLKHALREKSDGSAKD